MSSTALTRALAFVALCLGVIGALFIVATPVQALDEDLYARLLQRHTRETNDPAGVRVAYAKVRRDPEWAALVADLGASKTRVPTARDEALAFWINAYNILVIETVARGYPIESIRDIGSPIWPVWKHREIAVAGKPRSLDEIEHEILRPMGEPRVHAALVCASVSCPSLQREPWTAGRVEAQLETALQAWLQNPHKGLRIDRKAGKVWLSKVFDWFREDFGEDRTALLSFVSRRLGTDDSVWLGAHHRDVEVGYLHYDWRLNDLHGSNDMPGTPALRVRAP